MKSHANQTLAELLAKELPDDRIAIAIRDAMTATQINRNGIVEPEEYRSIRKKLALTQDGLAARLGVTRKTINARETRATRITEEAALAIRALIRQ